jgi:hypothetical protein
MEFVDGKVIDPIEDAVSIRKIANILAYFATLHSQNPGPLGGGPSRGLIFSDTEDVTFDSTQSMEDWFNSKLSKHNPKISFQGCKLVLCHLDIAPRNLLWLDNGDICLIDWASAGYYPRLFEFCVLWFLEGKGGQFNVSVMESMNGLPEEELAQKEPLLRAWQNMQRYSL